MIWPHTDCCLSVSLSLVRSSLHGMFHRLFARQRPLLATRALVCGAVMGATALVASQQKAAASDMPLHAPEMPWSHGGWAASFDTASLRRGLMVYQQVCAACHSMKHIPFRALVGVTHDTDGAKVHILWVHRCVLGILQCDVWCWFSLARSCLGIVVCHLHSLVASDTGSGGQVRCDRRPERRGRNVHAARTVGRLLPLAVPE